MKAMNFSAGISDAKKVYISHLFDQACPSKFTIHMDEQMSGLRSDPE